MTAEDEEEKERNPFCLQFVLEACGGGKRDVSDNGRVAFSTRVCVGKPPSVDF